MESEIAKMLNCTKSDKDKLQALLEEYMLSDSERDIDSDSDIDLEVDRETDDDDADFDMRQNDLDVVMSGPDVFPDVEGPVTIQDVDKSKEFT